MNKVCRCGCCGKEFMLPCKDKHYLWKLDNETYCSYNCYSKVFDSKYKPRAATARSQQLGWKTDKTLR